MKPKFYVLNNFNIQWLPNISHPQNQTIQFMNKNLIQKTKDL